MKPAASLLICCFLCWLGKSSKVITVPQWLKQLVLSYRTPPTTKTQLLQKLNIISSTLHNRKLFCIHTYYNCIVKPSQLHSLLNLVSLHIQVISLCMWRSNYRLAFLVWLAGCMEGLWLLRCFRATLDACSPRADAVQSRSAVDCWKSCSIAQGNWHRQWNQCSSGLFHPVCCFTATISTICHQQHKWWNACGQSETDRPWDNLPHSSVSPGI